MKIIKSVCFISIILLSCETETLMSYENGVNSCIEIRDRLMEETDVENFMMIPPELYGPDCLVGARLPDLEMASIDGKLINQDYFDDRITVINFWFKACAPCIAEIPGLNRLTNDYSANDVNFLAIGLDSTSEIKDFLVDREWGFDHISDGKNLVENVFLNQQLWAYPLTIIADENLRIISAFSGGRTDDSAGDHVYSRISESIESVLSN